jgi:hypothetical protein
MRWPSGPALKRALLVLGALVCLALATPLALLAADDLRWRDALRSGDVRYRAVPEANDLWTPAALVPSGAARNLLGVRDDLAFRRALRALRLARIGSDKNFDPRLAVRRAEAESRLEAIVAGHGDRARRSRAANLLGVIALAAPASTPQERAVTLKKAIDILQGAIALDPNNDEAKYNLELALRRRRGTQTVQGGATPTPSAGTAGAKGAATGPPGNGY